MSKCTILLDSTTRAALKNIGRKGQTYDALILELIEKAENKKSGQPEASQARPDGLTLESGSGDAKLSP